MPYVLTVMKKNDPGEFFKHCYACSAKHREARDTATPTPAQVKKALTVILAAQIADPIPPITQREVNSIYNYMDSQYYSLAAASTTTTTPSQLPATRRAEPWIPDSTNSIKDLHRPRKHPLQHQHPLQQQHHVQHFLKQPQQQHPQQ